MTFSSQLGRARGAIGASLLILIALGCDEEGKTAPEKCAEPPLEIYDIQDPPAGNGEAGAANPCVTQVGHAVSPASELGGTSNGGSTSGGSAGRGGSQTEAGADAGGMGGAPDIAEAGAGGS